MMMAAGGETRQETKGRKMDARDELHKWMGIWDGVSTFSFSTKSSSLSQIFACFRINKNTQREREEKKRCKDTRT